MMARARRPRRRTALGGILLALVSFGAEPADAQSDSVRVSSRPLITGGYDDKPYLTGIFGRIAVGGYVDFHGTFERVDGATEEGGFNLKRWNLLTHTRVSRQIEVWAEVEFEDGGQEIKLELAQLDYVAHTALAFRGGMLLVPIGRFNLSHDGPRNEFTDRPLIATDLIGTALSMPGTGLFGQIPTSDASRISYETYAVNGYTSGIIDNSAVGTRLPAGSANFEDNNASPSYVGRVAWDHGEPFQIGASGLTGKYNVTHIDGFEVDDARSVSIGALDLYARVLGFVLNGEGALVHVEVPPGLTSLYASHQSGFFLDVIRGFGSGWIESLPEASFSAAARVEGVDFDTAIPGDSRQQLSLGVHFRPTPQSVFKLDYQRGRSRDRFNNPSEEAGVLFSLTSYF